jgi:glycosyltransferase involved in cell wall biosynthesis
MVRICMVIFNHYPSDARVRREAEALVDRGNEVDCICLQEKGQEKIDTLYGVRLFQLSIGKYQGTSRIHYLTKYFLFFCSAFLKISFLHLKKRYDIVQVHNMPDFMVFVALIPKMLGAKVILDMHDLMPELYMSKFGADDANLWIKFITRIERWSIAFAHKVITVHQQDLGLLVKRGNPEEKLSSLLNVPDPKIFAPKTSPRHRVDHSFRLIYHGTVSKRYGLDVALRAVALARKEIPDLEFHIIGRGDDLQRVVDLANESRLDGCVQFHKSVPIEQLPPLITQADVGIVPYLNDKYTQYVLPVKLLEYVALGIPVIASRLEALEVYFDEKMLRYFQPGNEVELADHIVDLHRNPQKRERLVSNAGRFNETYNWQRQKILYLNLIDSMLSVKRVSTTDHE